MAKLEKMFHQILKLFEVFHKLPENIDLCLRAEVVMPRDEFIKLNVRQEEAGAKIFANPRNAAAGTVRQLDSGVAAERCLDAYFYDILDRENHSITTHKEAVEMLKSLGFKTDPLSTYCEGMHEIMDFYKDLGEKRNSLNYDLDGVVIKVNDYNLYEELGSTGKSPRWAVAFKYEAEQAQTLIKNISVQVGRTGVLTQLLNLNPFFWQVQLYVSHPCTIGMKFVQKISGLVITLK